MVSEAPSRYVKDWFSEAIAPSYWVPNSEIKVGGNIGYVFTENKTPNLFQMLAR